MTTIRARAALRVAALVMAASVAGPAPPLEASSHFRYVTMSDGVMIAIAVAYPPDFDPEQRYGTLFQMDGYAGGGSTFSSSKYVTVKASVRGTGCSGGRFDTFDRRSSEDGRDIIDGWIAQQPWSNGKVAIVGYSYPGLTGFMVATTQPEHLTVTAVGGLIDDRYRGIYYPGGVANYGFPVLWNLLTRSSSELPGNAARYAALDPVCLQNIASRPPQDPAERVDVRYPTQTEDGPWYHYRSLTTWTSRIDKPIHIRHHYQDEQTGPRGGPAVWERIPESTPKRLALTNGRHGTSAAESADVNAWIDCWMLHDGNPGLCTPAVLDPGQRVRVHFETAGNNQNEAYVGAGFPLPQTAWARYHLRADGSITGDAPAEDEGTRTYVAPPRGRQGANGVNALTASSGPDELSYVLDFGEPTAIAGPVTLNLTAAATGPELDFMVTLIDLWPDGRYEYLQRGLLRGSHRAVDHLRSDRIDSGPFAGTIYRPHRPHTNPQPVIPGTPAEYLIEVFPVGHVFRDGHRLLVKVSAPSALDPVSETWAYPQSNASPVVTIHHDRDQPTSLLLPVLPELPPIGEARSCGAQSGLRCVTPALP